MRPCLGTDRMWLRLLTIAAVTAVVSIFVRFRSNERVEQAIASGAVRRRSETGAAPSE